MLLKSPNPLPENTRLGCVHLTVSDLSRSITFYRDILGLKLHQQDGSTAQLGAGSDDLVQLTEISGAKSYPRRSGLYHYALLVPTRAELGSFLNHAVQQGARFQGFADHLVSEAIYLPDPDGNGIEVYRDRPRADWKYEDGKIKMATDPFDFDGVSAAANVENQWPGMSTQTVLGHMHLHVGDLEAAETFYRDTVGLNVMNAEFPSARFLSAGGYHHHLGINTWNGVGAPPPPEDAVGLRYYSVILPDNQSLNILKERIKQSGGEFQPNGAGFMAKDPAGNGIVFTLPESS